MSLPARRASSGVAGWAAAAASSGSYPAMWPPRDRRRCTFGVAASTAAAFAACRAERTSTRASQSSTTYASSPAVSRVEQAV
jgi:hypothetical protein